MNVKSLGYRTDLIFHAFDGEISDRGVYLVIRTPLNPTFYWGNFLLFSHPPGEGDLRAWSALFAQEIGAPPETKHLVFGWDSPTGDVGVIQPFLETGFRVNRDVVLTCSKPSSPARPSDRVSIQALKTAADWAQAVENQVSCRAPEFSERDYRDFRRRQMDRYRKMVVAGLGDWFGAFADRKLVADLGIFHTNSVGRFQSIQTHPEYRRQGIAGALIYEAAGQTQARHNLHTLVIVAEQASNPARLYKSLGFQQTEQQVGLEWWPQIGSPSNDGS
jgi:ribosomal protein S18 acetylase RimI-like enzyme